MWERLRVGVRAENARVSGFACRPFWEGYSFGAWHGLDGSSGKGRLTPCMFQYLVAEEKVRFLKTVLAVPQLPVPLSFGSWEIYRRRICRA